jgi:hypothetical protein
MGLTSALVGMFVVVVGWRIAHRNDLARDEISKRREQRLTFLIEAYRRLEALSNRSMTVKNERQLESAIADIQLFGNAAQVAAAQTFALRFTSEREASLDDLLNTLRVALRRELGADIVETPLVFLRIDRNKVRGTPNEPLS